MGGNIVEMHNISKAFPGVLALDQVSFNLKSGEVLALLGENGAGKSTLMKVLSGIHIKDNGKIKIFGKEYEHLTPRQAQKIGVSIIHQELNMCAHLTVAENIFLGREKCVKGILSKAEMSREAEHILKDLNIDLDPNTVVGDLPVSKQQMVEIAKAISTNAKILIMDEPTSALTSKEIDDLFRIIRKLKKSNCGIVYISHRLGELQYIVDRVMIMRDGKFIISKDFKEFSMKEIISNMVGREIKEQFPRVHCEKGEKIFEVKNLNAGRLVRDINFSLYAGEIVGIAGLMGAGRTEMTRAIFGVDMRDTGEFYLEGKEVIIKKPSDSINAGIILVPEDRKKDGLCTKLSIRENITLPNLDIICDKLGVVKSRVEKEIIEKTVRNLKIKVVSSEVDAGTLSGGNQQKVVVGKWLARKSKVAIFDEPTRGIDVAAKVEIYNLMNQLKKEGIAVVFVSSEMPEVLGMSDRILVMCDGRITGEMACIEATQDKILTLATQFEVKLKDKTKIEQGVSVG